MDRLPQVSVVIPTYNCASLLTEAIGSVVAQTVTDWEIIVVNNFSQDDTRGVVTRFHDSRMRLIDFRNEGIIGASRNIGVGTAKSDIIAFLDSDDTWYPDKLATCMEMLHAGADMVCHGLRYVRNGQKVRDVVPASGKHVSYRDVLYGDTWLATPSATMVRKECFLAVGGFCESPAVVTSEDYDLWLKLLEKKYRGAVTQEILGEYRLHDNNASKSTLRQLSAAKTVLARHFESTDNDSLHDRILKRRRLAVVTYAAARSLQQDNRKDDAVKYYLESLRMWPFFFKSYFGLLMSFFGVHA
jgi:glycosyltransferase involved in cell wall biosynthesis